jgi:hypothetical protein
VAVRQHSSSHIWSPHWCLSVHYGCASGPSTKSRTTPLPTSSVAVRGGAQLIVCYAVAVGVATAEWMLRGTLWRARS